MVHLAPQYLRSYFITTATANRRRVFQVEANARLLLSVMLEQREKRRFELYAFVIMPDHLHAILTPAPDISLEKSVQFIKGNLSYRLKSKLPVWTPSFNEVQVRDAISFEEFRRYIHQNPVRAGLVAREEEFLFSSAGMPNAVDPAPMHLRR